MALLSPSTTDPTGTVASVPNLIIPFTPDELSRYAAQCPQVLAVLSFPLGRGTLWTSTGQRNRSEQWFISLRLTRATSFARHLIRYRNVPEIPVVYHFGFPSWDVPAFHDQTGPVKTRNIQYQFFPSPLVATGVQVDLHSHFRLLLNRLGAVTDRVALARESTLKWLDEIYHFCPESPVPSSVIPTLVAKHAYLSLQARALNVHPPPPRRVLERVELNPNGTMRMPQTRKNDVQCLDEMRKDLPVLYQQVRQAVERLCIGMY